MPVSKDRLSAWLEGHALFVCVGIALIGAALRFYSLGARSLWLDEAIEVLIARAPLSQMTTVGAAWLYTDPPLNSWILHLVLKLGSADTLLRIPYAVAGTLAVYASYHLFRLWLPAPAALLGEGVLALAPWQVYYAQEVGQYALVILFAILILWSFEKTIRQPDRRSLAVLTVCGLLGMFTHYGLWLLLIGLALTIPFRHRPREWWRWLPVGAGFTLGALLLYFLNIENQYQVVSRSLPASPPQWSSLLSTAELRAVGMELARTLRLFLDNTQSPGALIPGMSWLLIAVFLIGFGVVLDKRHLRPIAAYLLLPVVLSYFATQYGYYYWGHRYLIFISPVVYLSVAVGISALGDVARVLKLLPLGLAVVLLLNQTYPGWPNEFLGEDIRPVVGEMQRQMRPEDGVYVYYGARAAFTVYYSGPRDNVRFGETIRSQPLARKIADIEPAIRRSPRWWFVASHMTQPEVSQIVEEMDRRCRRTTTIARPNALAVRYECGTPLTDN